MAKAFDVIVAGHICLDIIPDLSPVVGNSLETLLQPGHLSEVGDLELRTGGAVSNTGLVLHRLGIPTCLMGKVGGDLLGQIVGEILAAYEGPSLDGMLVDNTTATSYTVIISLPSWDRAFLHYPGANATFNAADVRYDLVSQARLFHFGYPPLMKHMFDGDGTQLTHMFQRVKRLGLTTCLDMAVPDPASPAGQVNWRRILSATLPYVDVFLPSFEEILYMLRRDIYETFTQDTSARNILDLLTPSLLSRLGAELLEMGGKIVGLKLGHRGLYVVTADERRLSEMGSAHPSDLANWANREAWAPCFEVRVAGTTGAGDATIAGFVGALLRDVSFEKALTAAVAVGACNVEAIDAVSGIRTWEETWRRIREGWNRHDSVLDAPGWHSENVHHLWLGPADGAC